MLNTASVPPEDLIADLTMSLWYRRGALRDLARRKAWEPSIDDYRRIAEHQVEQLKRHGVLQVTRQVAVSHSMAPNAPLPRGPSVLPLWSARPTTDT